MNVFIKLLFFVEFVESDVYLVFFKVKVQLVQEVGFIVVDVDINLILKDYYCFIVKWVCVGGWCVIFVVFGFGKMVVQLEIIWFVLNWYGGWGLIVMLFGVWQEFCCDVLMLEIG